MLFLTILIALQPAGADEEDTDHEIVECLSHKIIDGHMHIRVLMESHDKKYKSYKDWAKIEHVFQDCEKEAIEENMPNWLVDYAEGVNAEKQKQNKKRSVKDVKLYTAIAGLAKTSVETLFPNYREEKEEEEEEAPMKKCEADHDEKFDGGDYKEVPYGAFYFTGEEKWSKEKCWFCDKELAKLKPKNQAPAMVCEHIYHDKGTCEKGFLCNACYGKKQITEKGGRRRRTTRAS